VQQAIIGYFFFKCAAVAQLQVLYIRQLLTSTTEKPGKSAIFRVSDSARMIVSGEQSHISTIILSDLQC